MVEVLIAAGPIVKWMHPEDTDKYRRFEDLVYRIAHDPKKEEEGEGAEVSELKPPSDPPAEPPEDSKA